MEEQQAAPVTLTEHNLASDYALKNLNAALGKAQTKFTPAVKNLENKYGGYKYVPLESIIHATRPALAENHLTVMQFTSTDLERKVVSLLTRLTHWDSGEWTQNLLEVPGELAIGQDSQTKFNQKTIGGATTYARKIAYKPIVGVADSDDDIDAGGEQPNIETAPKKKQAATPSDAAKLEADRVRWLDTIASMSPETFASEVIGRMPEDAQRTLVLCADKAVMASCFNRIEGPENFSAFFVPLNKIAVKERREFLNEVRIEAAKRGYEVDRANGTYVLKGAK